MKKILLTAAIVCSINVVANAQETAPMPAKAEQPVKKMDKEAEKAKRDAQTLEAFTAAGLTAEEQQKAKAIMDEASEKNKAIKKDATMDEATKKAKQDEVSKEKNSKLKELMGEAKYKLYGAARKAQKEADKAANPMETKQ